MTLFLIIGSIVAALLVLAAIGICVVLVGAGR